VAGELGRAMGLPVPEIVFAELDPALGAAEPDPEVRQRITVSGGLNLGIDFLPGALPFRTTVGPPPEPDLAAAVVWFDALLTNPDRTIRNPNILVWHRRHWLIDHGAALYIHFTWRDADAHARRSFDRVRDHVLLPYAGSIDAADERLAGVLTPEVVASIVDQVPDDWLADDALSVRSTLAPTDQRTAYVAYLGRGLEAPRPFVAAAEAARAGA